MGDSLASQAALCDYPPAISTVAAARYACKMSGWALLHFDLHRILYIAAIIFAGRTGGGQMITEGFEAWDYGPILPTLYNHLRPFGNEKINVDVFPDADRLGSNEYTRHLIEETCPKFKGVKSAELVALTQLNDGAWSRNYRKGAGLVIPVGDMQDEYERYYKVQELAGPTRTI